MNSSLLVGKDYENNKNVVLNCDNNGILQNSKLQYYRNQARCFVISNYTTTNSASYNLIAINNPTGSNKKVFVYSINIKMNGAVTTNPVLAIKTFYSGSSGGTTDTGKNLKLGHTDASSVVRKNGFSVGADGINLFSIRTNFSQTTADYEEYLSFYDEMIELPAGYGIYISWSNADGTNNINASYQIRFIEVDDNQVL